MSSSALWTPITVGAMKLAHRIAMAPMTRNRSTPDGVPTELNAEYYAQRASTGLIISEGAQPSADGQGYPLTPGIYTEPQIEGWRRITDAVHAADGHMVIQVMHAGRIAHPANTQHGRTPLAPSAVRPSGTMFTAAGPQEMPEPCALTVEEIARTVGDFRHAAACAIRAGADGVEVHGANGYLVQQFLSTSANRRDDHYGGSIEGRIRFALEVVEAIAAEIGPERTAIRLSPGNTVNDIVEEDVTALYDALVRELAGMKLAYLHVAYRHADDGLLHQIRQLWPGVFFLNRGGADLETRARDVESGLADVITIGAMTLANPDLVDRLRQGAAFNQPDRATFYGGDAKGYTDYPRLS